MYFQSSLIEGTLIKRYKRFLADIRLNNNEIITAHCPNSGSMLNVAINNQKVFVSPVNNPKAKLKYKWELCSLPNKDTLIGIDTSITNTIAEEAIKNQSITELSKYSQIKREVYYKKGCRFDFELNNNNKKCYVEVKNVTLSRINGIAEFPDAVTSRGLKHINELINALNDGFESYLLYIIQRDDCNKFMISKDIDKEYYDALQIALKKGVKILCYNCKINLKEINIYQKVDFII